MLGFFNLLVQNCLLSSRVLPLIQQMPGLSQVLASLKRHVRPMHELPKRGFNRNLSQLLLTLRLTLILALIVDVDHILFIVIICWCMILIFIVHVYRCG